MIRNVPVLNSTIVWTTDQLKLLRPIQPRDAVDEINRLRKRELNSKLLMNKIDASEIVNRFAGFPLLHSDAVKGQIVYFSTSRSIHTCWQIFDPAIGKRDSRVWIVDAESGDILHSYPSISKDQAMVYDNVPTFGKTPPINTIDGVFNDGTRISSIHGKDFVSSNTCFAYRCANSTDGNCDSSSSICIDDTEGLKEGFDYFTSTYYFLADGREIDWNFDWQANGYKDNKVILAWKNAPVVASRLKRPSNGIWGSELSWDKYDGTEIDDANSELQAYFFLNRHAKFMRDLLQDQSFCFLGSGANCSVIDSSTNLTTLSNSSPIHIFVNYQKISGGGSKYPDIITQISNGLGKNVSNPAVFDQRTPYGDAFFARMPIFSDDQRNCSDAGCIDQSSFAYTHFAFGQSSNSKDWALNECVAYHELNHALVAQFNPLLPSYVWADTGLRSDPGALNEAWADYFAAIHCGISDFTKTYNGRPNRNINNNLTCSDSFGEVHVDSLIFSGALWKIRTAIPTFNNLTASDQQSFDRLVLTALKLSQPTDMFSSQFTLILSLLKNDTTLSSLYSLASQEFTTREFECERVQLFEERGDPTFHLPGNSITTANLSTLPVQLKLEPRVSDWGAIISWKQWAVSSWFGAVDVGYATQSLQMLISPCSIIVSGNSPQTIKTQQNCSGIVSDINWVYSKYSKKYGSIEFDFPLGTSNVYLVVASTKPSEMVMYSSALSFYGFNRVWRITIASYGYCFAILFLYTSSQLIVSLWKKKGDVSLYKRLSGIFLFGTLSSQFATFALIYGLVREIFTIVMFPVLILQVVFCYFFFPISISSRYTLTWKVGNIIYIVDLIISLVLCIVTTSPIAAHVVFYILFWILGIIHLGIILSSLIESRNHNTSSTITAV